MTNKITEVTQMTGGSEGISLLIDSWRNQISQDQQYREFTQNSIESIERVQKKNPDYKGIIKWDVDQTYFKKYGVKKLCIIDNGEGMTPQEMLENINTLGGSTRNNQYHNHGCGAKIAGLAHNRAGIIYRSWKNGQGYVVKFMRNEMGRYGAVKHKGKNSFPIAEEMKPSVIEKHGCTVTLLGDSAKEDTTIPSNNYGLLKGSRLAKSEWLTCYLNTKFYNVPNNIRITASRFTDDGVGAYLIKGHEYGLKHDFDKTDEVQLTKTKVKIFYRGQEIIKKQTQYMTNGQLGIVNQDEIIKLEFVGSGGFNVLPAWGLQCLKKQVALILIPEGQFKQNIERTDLVLDGMRIQEQLNLWKTEFKERMPEWLKEIEAKKQQEQLDKDNDNAEILKKLAPLFKKERYYNSNTSDIDIEKTAIRKASSKKSKKGEDPDPNPNPDHDPKNEFGELEAIFGTNVDKSKYMGKKINLINEYPEIFKVKDGPSTTVGSFVKDTYTIEINVESNLVMELVDYIYKKFPKIMKTVIIDEVFKMIGLGLQQQVAHVHNRTDASEEEIDNALSSLSLTACAANKDYIVGKLTLKFKNKDKKLVNKWNKDEHKFHISNNPNRFPLVSKHENK